VLEERWLRGGWKPDLGVNELRESPAHLTSCHLYDSQLGILESIVLLNSSLNMSAGYKPARVPVIINFSSSCITNSYSSFKKLKTAMYVNVVSMRAISKRVGGA
jgi:hypothetical protein